VGTPGTTAAWLVAYLPASELSVDQAWAVLDDLRSTVTIAAEPFDHGA
jgi:hypothetical protein